MSLTPKEMLLKNDRLIQSDDQKVLSHAQRQDGEWYLNTIMLTSFDVPFKYRRKKLYKSLIGQKVNLTYYPDIETVAGFDIEIMRVVRLRRS